MGQGQIQSFFPFVGGGNQNDAPISFVSLETAPNRVQGRAPLTQRIGILNSSDRLEACIELSGAPHISRLNGPPILGRV